jgi:hypothetical protein
MESYFKWVTKTLFKAGFAPLFVFTFHILSTRVFGIYRLWPNFDDIMHFSGGVAIAYFFVHALIIGREYNIFSSFTKFTFVITAFSFTSTVAVIWEFLEWASDHYLGTYLQNSLDDTMLDMLLGMCGGLVVIVISILLLKNFFTIDNTLK